MSVEQSGIAHLDISNPSLAMMTEEITSAENRYSGIPTMQRTMKADDIRGGYQKIAPLFSQVYKFIIQSI